MGRSEIVALIREYARVNWNEVSASVTGDPVLRGRVSPTDLAVSDDMQVHATVHSSKYHAAKDILTLMGEDVSDL